MRHHTRSTSCHNHMDRHRFNRSRPHSHSHRYRSHSWSNSQRSHSRSYHRHPHRNTSCHRYLNTYHHQWDTHIEGLHCIEALPHTLAIVVGLNHIPHTKFLNPHTALTRQSGNTRIRNINKSPLMTPHPNISVLMNHPVSQMRI